MARSLTSFSWLANGLSFFAAIVAAFRMIPFDDRFPECGRGGDRSASR